MTGTRRAHLDVDLVVQAILALHEQLRREDARRRHRAKGGKVQGRQ